MSKFKNDSLNTFLTKVASKEPTPGGGSVAALSGALSASLIEMVCNLTLGKKGYEKSQREIKEIASKAKSIGKRLLDLVDEDSMAYQEVMKAYKLPKERKDRSGRIEKSLKHAALVPLETAQLSNELGILSARIEKIGNKNAVTDARSAQYLARAAKLSALENVEINLKYIKDKNFNNNTSKKIAGFI